MNAIIRMLGIAAIAVAFLVPVQQAQACDLNELQAKIQSFLAGIRGVDPVLYAHVEQERKESIAKFTSAVTAAWKEYLAELKERHKEYFQLLKEYVIAQFSAERAKVIAKVNERLDIVKGKIQAALEKYKAKVKAFENELGDKIQDMINDLARA